MINFRSIAIAITAITLISGTANAQSKLGKFLDGAVKTVQNATATTKFEAKDLVGSWKYESPAVAFKGDNALANIGGAAGATAVEDQLKPYYDKAGMEKMAFEVKNDLSFTLTVGVTKLQGTITKDKNSNLIFNLSALGKIPLGKLECIATKSGNVVNLTFDAQKVLSLVKTIGSLSSSSSIASLTKLLNNYKDMYIGAKLKRR